MTDITQRLRAASLDDRLSTGALYREAAEMIEDANAAGIEQEQIIMNQERAIDRLRAALRTLYLAAPTALDCQDFHHSKAEQHTYEAPCKPRQDYLDALAAARTALGDGNADQA